MDNSERSADLHTTPPGEPLGFLAIRHALTPDLLEVGGHIGYSMHPTARNKGAASTALLLGLDKAYKPGIEKVLPTVKEDNTASRRAVEGAGGQFRRHSSEFPPLLVCVKVQRFRT